GGEGLNTGGMGTYSPAPFLTDAGWAGGGARIRNPWLKGCAADGLEFRGPLYPGVMLPQDQPKVIEFNARFGDPEAQVYLTRLENDLLDLLDRSVAGTLDQATLRWKPQSAI